MCSLHGCRGTGRSLRHPPRVASFRRPSPCVRKARRQTQGRATVAKPATTVVERGKAAAAEAAGTRSFVRSKNDDKGRGSFLDRGRDIPQVPVLGLAGRVLVSDTQWQHPFGQSVAP